MIWYVLSILVVVRTPPAVPRTRRRCPRISRTCRTSNSPWDVTNPPARARRKASGLERRSAMQPASLSMSMSMPGTSFDRHDSPTPCSSVPTFVHSLQYNYYCWEGRRYKDCWNQSFDVQCDSASSTLHDVMFRRFCRRVANHCLTSRADLCSHVRQQVRTSTWIRPTFNFGDVYRWQGLEGY
jgi:hypothetical protein